MLTKGVKFKDTPYSVGEDFCSATRFIRKELLRFARQNNAPFKLRHKKLLIGKKTFYYDMTTSQVKETVSSTQ